MYPNAAYGYSQLNTGHPNVRYRFLQTRTECSNRGNEIPEACLENPQIRAGYSNHGNEIPEACLRIFKSSWRLAIRGGGTQIIYVHHNFPHQIQRKSRLPPRP
jgi:hypothetical protein